MPLVTFIIPVRHQDNAADWPTLKRNLAQTIASIAAQTDGDWRAVIVANEGADLPPLPDRFEVERVDFPPNDLHDLGTASRAAVLDAFRLDKGRRVLKGMLRARPTGFYMIVDDDDFVSNRLVAHAAARRNAAGWVVDRGYVWAEGGALLYAHDQFDRLCGTSLVIRADLYGLPERFEEATVDYVKTMLGSHVRITEVLADAGTPLATLPFRGAVYRVAHRGAHSRSRGLLREFFLRRAIVVRPWLLIARLGRLRRMDARAHREFFGARSAAN